MPICKNCSAVITALVLRCRRQERCADTETKNHVRLYDPKTAQSCWICTKFRDWVQAEYSELLQDDFPNPINMEFHQYALFIIRSTSTGMLTFNIELDIGTEGVDRNIACCKCNVFVVPA